MVYEFIFIREDPSGKYQIFQNIFRNEAVFKKFFLSTRFFPFSVEYIFEVIIYFSKTTVFVI